MTFVIVASDKPHDLSRLETTDVLLTEQQLNEYLNKEKPLILRDEYVPVDNLLAPVFEDSFRM
jgi:hypothetical protein